jgi:glutamate-1-semialdehyde aminotransferase
MNGLVERIKREVRVFCEANDFGLQLIGLASWAIPHFVSGPITGPRDLRELEGLIKQEVLCQYMRYHRVYLPDLHTVFVSAVHTNEDADIIIEAFKRSLTEMREDGYL